MYTSGNTNRETTTQNEFPIDISSDESDVEAPEKKSVNNGIYTFLIYLREIFIGENKYF